MPSRSKKRQSELGFTPVPTSSPAHASTPVAIRDRAAFVTIGSPSPAKRHLPTPKPTNDADEDIRPLTFGTRTSTRKSATPLHFMNTSRTPKSKKGKPVVIISDESESDPEETFPLPSSMLHSSPPGLSAISPRRKNVVESDDNDEDQPAHTPRVVVHRTTISRPTRQSTRQKAVDSQQTRTGSKRKLNQLSESDEDEDDVVMPSSRRSTRAVAANPSKHSRHVKKLKQKQSDAYDTDDDLGINDDDEEAIDQDEDEDEDDLPVRRGRRSQATVMASDESEIEEATPVTSRRRDRAKPSTTAIKPRSQKDQADLDSDLEFLGDADNSAALRGAPVSSMKHARLSKLDELKALRDQRTLQLSQAPLDLQSSPLSRGRRPQIISDEEDVDEEESAIDDDENDVTDDNHVDEDDFVVEDDEDAEPVMLPAQFSRLNKEKPRELFKLIVEWMISKKINPAFSTEDEVYGIAFRRLDDFVGGMGGSKFHSSAWTPEFGKSLKARPRLEDYETGASILHDKCDACNRSGHPATWEVRFTGPTYNKDTLEVDEDDDSDDSEAEVRARADASEQTTYYIGKFCMRNARTAHAFQHWKFHLNEWVVDHLKNIKELTAAKIIERDGWSTKRRRRDAERITDEMERSGEIRKLHRDFKNEIESAQFADNSSKQRNFESP